MNETFSDEFGLEVRHYMNDDKCLGVFYLTKHRDDNLPVLFLHSKECWSRLFHSCKDLPDQEPSLCENDNGVIVDYNYYDQIVHMVLDGEVYREMDMLRYSMDWTRISRVSKDYA